MEVKKDKFKSPPIVGKLVSSRVYLSRRIVVGGESYSCIGDLRSVVPEFALSRSSFSPIVTYKDRAFCLTWEDICRLAFHAGLFDEVPNE